VFTSSRPVKKRSIHVVSSWTRNHDRWTRVDMTSCLTKLTICIKMRSIGKSWTRDYQDHVISWTRVHDLNGTQHEVLAVSRCRLLVGYDQSPTLLRVSNTPGNLLELFFFLEIYWKFTQSLLEIFWFSLRVSMFVVNISYSSCISECISTKYFFKCGKPGSIDIEVSNLGKCQR